MGFFVRIFKKPRKTGNSLQLLLDFVKIWDDIQDIIEVQSVSFVFSVASMLVTEYSNISKEWILDTKLYLIYLLSFPVFSTSCLSTTHLLFIYSLFFLKASFPCCCFVCGLCNSFKLRKREVLIGWTGHCPVWSTFLELNDQAALGIFGQGG